MRRWTLRGLTQGDGSEYTLLSDQIEGLDLPDVRAVDSPFQGRDGAHGAADDADVRTLRFPTGLAAPDEMIEGREAHALGLLRQWKRAWAPSTTDLELVLQVDGLWTPDTVSVFGRPRVRAGSVDLRGAFGGVVAAVAEFVALDPWFYGPARIDTELLAASPLVMPVDGDVPTRRFTIAVAGNGGTPSVSSTTEGKAITWGSTLALGQTVTLDFLTTTAKQAGVDVYPFTVDQWFRLLPGSNTLTFSGCASISVTHRPAYL